MYNIEKNKDNFYEVVNKPTSEELNDFYKKKYYQENHGDYKKEYSEEELEYFNSIGERYNYIISKHTQIKNVLDIGCGEGFLLNFFSKKNYNVCGLDFSDSGILNHNKHLINNFIKCDIFEMMEKIKEKYSVIILQNVLEHVLEPKKCLNSIKRIIENNGVVVIRVPNDFSPTQDYLLNNKYIDNKYWICPPEHISYFNTQSLITLCESCGYKITYYMTDYPIDFDLFVENTNYIKHKQLGNKEVGKNSHLKRIKVENFLNNVSIEKTCNYYKALADMNLGREIIIFLTVDVTASVG